MNAGKLINVCKFVSRNVILQTSLRNYAIKTDLKIKWIRPEKIPSFKAEKSGDLEPMPKIDLSQYQPDFRDCKELENADELVKRLFTLEFAPRSKSIRTYIQGLIGNVHRHPSDYGSIEAKIARWTGEIRAMQDVMERFPRYTGVKVKLNELIDRRRKNLKYLRRWDYKKFEWLIEHLNIVYKPTPPEYSRVTRKDSMRKLTKLHCDGIVTERLNEYKLKLREEQPAFLQEKIRSLEYIREEQRDCGVPVTVQQEDIDKAKEELEKLLRERQEQEE